MITDSILKNRKASCLLKHFKMRKKLEETLFDLELILIDQFPYIKIHTCSSFLLFYSPI